MTIFKKKIAVEMNSWGGVILHIPAINDKPAFDIWNRLGGGWGVTSALGTLDKDGSWGEECATWDCPTTALWTAFGWPESITEEEHAIIEEDANA